MNTTVRSTRNVTRKSKRAATAALAAAAVATAGLVGSMPAAEAATVYGTTAQTVNVHSAPGTNYTVGRTIAANTRIALDCYVYAQPVNGRWGKTALWQHLPSGGFVSDGFINTGSQGPVRGQSLCSWVGKTRQDKAIDWYVQRIGVATHSGQCQRAVENAYGTAGRFPTATAAYNSARSRGVLRTTGTPPKACLGVLVLHELGGPRGAVPW